MRGKKIVSATAVAWPIRMPDIRAIQAVQSLTGLKSHGPRDNRVGLLACRVGRQVGILPASNDAAIRWRQPHEVSCWPSTSVRCAAAIFPEPKVDWTYISRVKR